MKRLFLTLLLAAVLSPLAGAQKVAFIKTDSILAAIPQYANAQKTISLQADAYRAELEAELGKIDELYNSYQSQKQYLSSSAKTLRENQIISLENALKEKQNKYFGKDGEMERSSAILLAPIKEKVNAAIRDYAVGKGYEMVVDISVSSNVVYYNENADITKAIIEILN